MTERSMGSDFKWFVGKVVNRGDGKEGQKDNTESGRVQVRIFGKHDDEKNVPDSSLPWAVPLQPIAGPSKEGVGSTPVGLKKDSIVVGFYADVDETIPILLGVLHRSGKDGGEDGTDIVPSNNDLPKGSRSADTQGKDINDVSQKPIYDTAKQDQLHLEKKTIGDLPFDGSGALSFINKADPSNLSGAIPGALNGLKSITSTLNVAGLLMSNFSKITSGKFDIGLLSSLIDQAAKISKSIPGVSGVGNIIGNAGGLSISGSPVQQVLAATGAGNVVNPVSNVIGAASSLGNAAGNIIGGGGLGNLPSIPNPADIGKSLAAAAFGGGNPLASIVSGLGGVSGLTAIAGKASGLLGPISGNFGAASAFAGTLQGSAKSIFSSIPSAPIPKIPGLGSVNPVSNIMGNIGNIAGISGALGGIGGAAAFFNNSPIGNLVGNVSNSVGNIVSNITGVSILGDVAAAAVTGAAIAELNNSSIQLPSTVRYNQFSSNSSRNPGVHYAIAPTLNKSVRTVTNKPAKTKNYNNVVKKQSSTSNINSLENTLIEVAVLSSFTASFINSVQNQNPGANYNIL
jgi:hypothetical protein